MTETFDIERYLNNSSKVEIDDLALARAADFPLNPDEIRCLTFMMDIESHTMLYLKGLLRTCAVRDPEVMAFLHCWVYEEFFHGRALRQFLEAAGCTISPTRVEDVHRKRLWRERVEELGASMLCGLVQDFAAVYLTWGAVQELSTLEGYGILAHRTQNPVLRDLLLRLIKDERRHFSFYFNKARVLLQSTTAQRMTAWTLRRFWTPVGQGVKTSSDVEWTVKYLFGGAQGLMTARRIDSVIARLPGLEALHLLTKARDRALRESTNQLWYYLPTHEHRRSN
jgi:hypothetical protein